MHRTTRLCDYKTTGPQDYETKRRIAYFINDKKMLQLVLK